MNITYTERMKEILNRIISLLRSKESGILYYSSNNDTLLHRIIEILRDKSGELGIPDDEIEALAEAILPDIIAYFQSEEEKREFTKWEAKGENK